MPAGAEPDLPAGAEPDLPAGAAAASRMTVTVSRGDPDPGELAAVVAVLAARAGQPAAAPRAPRSEWAARSRLLRGPVRPGPGAWRASALPG